MGKSNAVGSGSSQAELFHINIQTETDTRHAGLVMHAGLPSLALTDGIAVTWPRLEDCSGFEANATGHGQRRSRHTQLRAVISKPEYMFRVDDATTESLPKQTPQFD